MVAVEDPGLADPRLALARTRRWATAVLAAMVALYVATHFAGAPAEWVALIRSMAEAGMVGGLADWFAVTALFRHPLGLPIPHTALLPRNQARAARNVGRFFETHFLAPEQVAARLRAMEPSLFIAEWLARQENALVAARHASDLIATLLRHDPSPRTSACARAWLRRQELAAFSDEAIAGNVATMAKAAMRGGVIDDILALVHREIDENRDVAAKLVQDNSRWWIARTVDRRVAELAVSAVLSLVEDLSRKDCPRRERFEETLDQIVDSLAAEGALARAVSGARADLARSGETRAMVATVFTEIRERLASRLDEYPEPLAELIRDAAARLLADPADRATLDDRLAQLAAAIIGEARPHIAGYVADVIAGWEPKELNARFEEEIGADLQFIRINGALLGFVIGGILFAVEALAG